MEGRAPYPYHRKKAVQHGEAMRIRQVKDKLVNVRREIKEKRLRREEVDFEAVLAGCPEFKLDCDPMEFSEIGCELPLYFMFLRWLMKQMCLYVVVGVFLVLALYWPICYAKTYEENFWNPGPTSCGGSTTWPMTVLCSLMFWFTYREVLRHREQQSGVARAIGEGTVAPSDYAVLVRGLPKDATETEVEVFFVKRGFESTCSADKRPCAQAASAVPAVGAPASPRPAAGATAGAGGGSPEVQVVKVMMCKDCTEVMRLRRERQKLLKKQAAIEKREDVSEAQVGEVSKQIADVTQKLGQRSLVDSAASTGAAIVIFKSQATQRAILEHWNFLNDPGRKILVDLDQLCFGVLSRFSIFKSGLPKFRGERVSVKRADNPTNIKWENIAVSKLEKAAGAMASWIVMLVVLALDYWLAYNALQWQKEQVDEGNLASSVAISLLIAGFMSLMNHVLHFVAFALAPLEKHATESGSDRATMRKLVLALVINMCIINLLVNSSEEDWGGTSGLAQQVFSMCLSNAMAPLARLVDIMGLVRWVCRWRWERTMTEDAPLSEAEVETYYSFHEPTAVDLPKIYAQAISTFFLAMIYLPLAPVAAPALCLAAFGAQYLADKVFVTRYSRKPYTSTRANNPRAALDLVSNGMLLGSVAAGGFIGYSGRDGWPALLLGIAIACALFLVYLLPRQYQHQLFRVDLEGAKQAEAAKAEASYYDAQLAWPEHDQYHTTYPLYQSNNEMPSEFEEMSLLSRKLWELRLWVAFSPQDEEWHGFWGREKEKDRPFWSPRARQV